MPKPLSLTFLGTCSGGGPTVGRICSSLSLNMESASWLVDCAEGTQLQIQKVETPKLRNINKVFITHLHVDHCFGIVPLLSTAMSSARNPGKPSPLDNVLRLEFYGPSGLRKLIRTNLQITQMTLRGKYAAHELLFEDETPSASCEADQLHENEIPGRDIRAGEDGSWHSFEQSNGFEIHAAPLMHRVPCLGYVFDESPQFRITPEYLRQLDAIPPALLPADFQQPRQLLQRLANLENPSSVTLNDNTVAEPPPRDIPGRKIVVLGDTSDPLAIAPLAKNATVLVHEATNAWLPPELEKGTAGMTPAEVRLRAISRGHSTPDMAGEFAKLIGAKGLYLNHFSTKFPDPGPYARNGNSRWARVMREIERQATKAWSLGKAVAASDLMVVNIPSFDNTVSVEESDIS